VAAQDEFAAKGLAGARVNVIARESGANKRMIYHYFGSKEGLYQAALERVYEGLRGEEVRRAETLALNRVAAVVAGGDGGVGGLLEQGLTFRAHAQLIAQFLTGAIFRAFANRSDSLEPEREGGRLHDGSIGKWGLDLK